MTLHLVEAEDDGVRPPSPRTVAIERCAEQIERALCGKLTVHQRIGLVRAIDELATELEWICGAKLWP